MVLNPSRGFG